MLNKGIAFLFLMLTTASASSQGMRLSETGTGNNLFKDITGDVVYILKAPSRMSTQSSMKFMALTSLTLGFVSSFDKPINDEFIEENQASQSSAYFKLFKGMAHIGDVYDNISSIKMLAGLSGTFWLAGMNLHDSKMKATARLMVESYIIAGMITKLGKGIFGRSRPFTEHGSKEFDLMKFGSNEYRSFPSGHATNAFAMMTVIAKQYDSWWVKIPAYTLAASVAVQRIDSSNHWGADVLAGGAIGYWVGSSLVSRYKKLPDQSKLKPYIFGNHVGLILEF